MSDFIERTEVHTHESFAAMIEREILAIADARRAQVAEWMRTGMPADLPSGVVEIASTADGTIPLR